MNRSYPYRNSEPEHGNKFYTLTPVGYNTTGVKGSPQGKCDALANCTAYAQGRFNEVIASWKYGIPGNACDYYRNAPRIGLAHGAAPRTGAIMCWSGGPNKYGHVEFVEREINSYTVYTTASGYQDRPFYRQIRHKDWTAWGKGWTYSMLGFVYNPAVNWCSCLDEFMICSHDDGIYQGKIDNTWGNCCVKAAKATILTTGSTGHTVEWLQDMLNLYGYYQGNIDGYYGPMTEASVKWAQSDNGLKVDNIVSIKTIKKLLQI